MKQLGLRSQFLFRRYIFSRTGVWPPHLELHHCKEIEDHWKKTLQEETVENQKCRKEGQKYVLSMFPYPSGRLHMGHVRVYTISDAISRFYSLKTGVPSFQPMGFDAFGLPAENAAIEQSKSPSEWTLKNMKYMQSQLDLLGLSFKWSEPPLATCDPHNYYKWTQWIFIQMFKKGLAYQKTSLVNWDPIDCTVLADEQVDEEGRSWRSGGLVQKKKLKQWFLQTTRYSKELYDGLESEGLIDWGDIKAIQRNWIGDCNGINVSFPLENEDDLLTVWTQDPPSFIHSGLAFIALSQNHPHASESTKAVRNPLTNKPVPIIVLQDETLFTNGSSAFMGFPQLHEEHARICKEHSLPFKEILSEKKTLQNSSSDLNGLDVNEANEKVIDLLQGLHAGGYKTSSNLEDWLISRQRYWGTPIPIIYCPNCGTLPVPESDLPVQLPQVSHLSLGLATEAGSPLSQIKDWVRVDCPQCHSPDASRETDTMDTFVDSSWYFLRHIDPKNNEELVSRELCEKFMPVDVYVGGKEHAVLHLYFARFVNRFLYDIGVSSVREPFKQLLVQGLVKSKSYKIKSSGKYISPSQVLDPSSAEPLAKDTLEPLEVKWEKMSKSKYNGVEPTDVINKFGCDMTRFLILADVSPKSDRNWSEDSVVRIKALTTRLWSLVHQSLTLQGVSSNKAPLPEPEYEKLLEELVDARNYYVKQVTFSFGINRNLAMAISRIHGLLNTLWNANIRAKQESKEYQEALGAAIILLSPIAPHFCSELWKGISDPRVPKHCDTYDWSKSLFQQRWPVLDPDYKMKLKVLKNRKPFLEVLIPYFEFQRLSSLEEALEIICSAEPSHKDFLMTNAGSVSFRVAPDYEAVLNYAYRYSQEEIAEMKAAKKKSSKRDKKFKE